MSVQGPKGAADGGVEVKGSIVRGYAMALRTTGYFDKVAPLLSPSTRAMLMDPPASTAWTNFGWCSELLAVVTDQHGLPAARRLGRDAVQAGVAPLSRSLLEGMLRLFGVSPSTIFARIAQFAQLTTRGMEYRYTPLSTTSGRLMVAIPGFREVSAAIWESTAGSFEPTFEACKTTGTVESAVVRPGHPNVADFSLHWQPK